MDIAISVLSALCLAAAVWILVREHRRQTAPAPPADPWAPLVARRAVVNLHDGTAVDGVLVRQDGPLLVLREAVIHDGTSDGPPMADGELVVDRAQVAYLQFPMT